jgi:hypothetical protein
MGPLKTLAISSAHTLSKLAPNEHRPYSFQCHTLVSFTSLMQFRWLRSLMYKLHPPLFQPFPMSTAGVMASPLPSHPSPQPQPSAFFVSHMHSSHTQRCSGIGRVPRRLTGHPFCFQSLPRIQIVSPLDVAPPLNLPIFLRCPCVCSHRARLTDSAHAGNLPTLLDTCLLRTPPTPLETTSCASYSLIYTKDLTYTCL